MRRQREPPRQRAAEGWCVVEEQSQLVFNGSLELKVLFVFGLELKKNNQSAPDPGDFEGRIPNKPIQPPDIRFLNTHSS